MNSDCFIWSWFRFVCHCTEIVLHRCHFNKRKTNDIGVFPIVLFCICNHYASIQFSKTVFCDIFVSCKNGLIGFYTNESHDTVTKRKDEMKSTKVLGERISGFYCRKCRERKKKATTILSLVACTRTRSRALYARVQMNNHFVNNWVKWCSLQSIYYNEYFIHKPKWPVDQDHNIPRQLHFVKHLSFCVLPLLVL